MERYDKIYINGRWIELTQARTFGLIDPASGDSSGQVSLATSDDIDRAVHAARLAFASYSQTSRGQRVALLERIVRVYRERYQEIAAAITADMGAPSWLAEQVQAATGLAHLLTGIEVLERYIFESRRGATLIEQVPIGVCGLITPWNWPINQIACKVVPALAVGCTMVLKPSEFTPRSALLWAEVLDTAGVPPGVFNLVNGDAAPGVALCAHPDVDMISFTGSTRAGIEVARAAAPTVKRVCQELGGKSANIVLDDAELGRAIPAAIRAACLNSGQSCNAPTRLLVPNKVMDDAAALAREAARRLEVGAPRDNPDLGPVATPAQWEKIQALIQIGIAEGATLVAGGPGRPAHLVTGWYVKPTVFTHVTHDMQIAREEIFGPVVVIIGYEDEADAIRIANDSHYGLAGYVQSSDPARATRVARQLRVGQVTVNETPLDFGAPFGGFRQSGNGREWGASGFAEFLELRAIMGSDPPQSGSAPTEDARLQDS